ncbi:phage terminase small subunit [Streptomyces werraensis]|uniref:phage terminase small subunit n=1 Tax=Streptomyces werraensis TaxID=68284 RepID=UPI0036FBF49B
MTRGPKPKENAVRRNKHPHSQTLSAGATEGRALPPGLGIRTAGAKRFWKTWATSPQAAEWAETDWAELEITTKLVDEFYAGETKLAGEIRQRVAKWGATVEDRARLRMSITKDPEETPEEVSPEPTESDLDDELFRLLNEG